MPKVWVYGPTLTLLYPLKMAEIKKSHQATQISQYLGPTYFLFLMKSIITFCTIWIFSGTNELRVKDQEVIA